jgi:hypothetical protein
MAWCFINTGTWPSPYPLTTRRKYLSSIVSSVRCIWAAKGPWILFVFRRSAKNLSILFEAQEKPDKRITWPAIYGQEVSQFRTLRKCRTSVSSSCTRKVRLKMDRYKRKLHLDPGLLMCIFYENPCSCYGRSDNLYIFAMRSFHALFITLTVQVSKFGKNLKSKLKYSYMLRQLFSYLTPGPLENRIKCHLWILPSPAVYSGHDEFKLGPEASHPDILNGFHLSRQTADWYSKRGHDSFLPCLFKFIIQKSSHLSTLHNLVENYNNIIFKN